MADVAERTHVVDRRRARPAAPRVPRHHDLEDPVPREPGPDRSRSARRRATASSTPADVERLRFILREQREHFLPLKVIKERLDELDHGARAGAVRTSPAPAGEAEPGANAPADADAKAPVGRAAVRGRRAAPREDRRARVDGRVAPCATTRRPDDHRLARDRGDPHPRRARAGRRDHRRRARPARGVRARHAQRTRRAIGVLFDEDALAIARVASSFMRHGIEARHLRMYRAFAEREAACSSRCCCRTAASATPRRRRARARRSASCPGLGRQLRTALLRQAVRRSLMRLTCRRRVLLDADDDRGARRPPRRRDRARPSRRRRAGRRAEGRADLPRRPRPGDRRHPRRASTSSRSRGSRPTPVG